jgi:hypothetical protein
MNPQEIEKLDLHDHDVLVVRTEMSERELEPVTETLQAYITQAGLHNVLFISLRPGESLRAMSREDMRALLRGIP